MITTDELYTFEALRMPCGIKPSGDMVDLIEHGAILMRHSDGGWNEFWFRSMGISRVDGVPEGDLVLWASSDGVYYNRPWGDILKCMDDMDDLDDPVMMGWSDECRIPDSE